MKALVSNGADDGGLVAIHSLAAAGFEVVSFDSVRLAFGARSRFVSRHCVLPLAEPAHSAGLARLIEDERPDVLLPIGTRATRGAGSLANDSSSGCRMNVVGPETFMAAFDKRACMTACRELGIPCPRSYSLEEARAFLSRCRKASTLVVKPWCDVGAATDVAYVRDHVELKSATAHCEQRYRGHIIQEFVPGGVESMKTVVVLFSQDSELIAAFTMRKKRQWPPTGGPTAAALSTAEEGLVAQMLPLFRRWKWRGVAEVELKLDASDGEHKVIEVNPRFPGYLRFPVRCGLDLPLLAVWAAMGERCDSRYPAYRVGATYVAPTLFLKTVGWARARHGSLHAVREARRDLGAALFGVAEMLADPLPLLARTIVRGARS